MFEGVLYLAVGENAKAGRVKTVAERLRPPESMVLTGYAEMSDCAPSLVSITVQEGLCAILGGRTC